jgi:hypothetical protein
MPTNATRWLTPAAVMPDARAWTWTGLRQPPAGECLTRPSGSAFVVKIDTGPPPYADQHKPRHGFSELLGGQLGLADIPDSISGTIQMA